MRSLFNSDSNRSVGYVQNFHEMNSSINDSIQLEVFYDFDGVASIQTEWDEFIESIKGEIFLTFDWMRIWWKYYGKGRHLRIFLFRSEGKLVGILPTFLEKIWIGPFSIRIIKVVGTDFTPVTISVPVQKTFIKRVMTLFTQALDREWKWDVLHIGDICGRYDSFDFLCGELKDSLLHTFHINTYTKDVQTYFFLEDSLETNLAQMDKAHRHKIKRALRMALKQGVIHSSLASDQNFNEYFDDFVRLHQRQWKNIGQPGHFQDWPYSYEFHREFADKQLKKGRLRLLRIDFNNECMGYKCVYKFGDLYHLYLSARINESDRVSFDFNRISFCEQTRLATTVDNIVAMDSMRGKYDHKHQLGGEMLPVRSMDIYQKKSSAILRITIFKYLSMLIDIVYSKIWRRRIMKKLRLNSRPIWTKWIKTQGILYSLYRDSLPSNASEQ